MVVAMRLIDHHDGTLTFEAADRGEHSALLTIREDGVDATYAIRPEEAVALAAALREWALDRIAKAGIF